MSSAKPRSALSLTEQLALLENPTPTDFDPEALEQEHWDGEANDDSEGSGDEGGHDGREHYVAVGKSKLRKGQTVLLDPKYNGARVSRDKLYDEDEDEGSGSAGSEGEVEDGEKSSDESSGGVEFDSDADIRQGTPRTDEDDEIDSEDALGSEEERFSGYQFRGSLNTAKLGGAANSDGEGFGEDENEGEGHEEDSDDEDGIDDDEDSKGNHDEGDDEEEEDDRSESGEGEGEGEGEELARRDQLRKMMMEEQKNVLANISKAARADADKGAAVRQQQKTFDSFLSIRIKLQKALISTNSLTQDTAAHTSSPETWKAAEQAVLSLWNVIHGHRLDLSDSRTGSKRKHDDAGETITDTLWAKMRKLDRDATPWRDSTLDKWSAKTAGVATTSLAKKLNNVSTPRSLTASIRETLSSDTDRLVARTRTPRSMAPTCTATEDPEIFDDTDFYQLLLKALVDRRMVDGGAVVGSGAVRWTTAMRDAKKKKVVDTKASKGRKLRYQVQEKIQNFMAPMENNGWHEQQIDELFSSLLGQKVRVDEEDEDKDVEDVEMDGLRLFRS